MKTFEATTIIKEFNRLQQEIDDLWCDLENCCLKSPINIGTGLGLYKRLYNNKWEFKSLIAGSNITLTDNGNDITIAAITSSGFTCSDLLTCSTDSLPQGITNLYDKTVVLTPGTGISISGTYPDFTITNTAPDTNFITSVSDTSQIHLNVTAGALTASFISNNISQFTNDVPYLTGSTIPLTYNQIAFGDVSNLMTSSSALTFDGNAIKVIAGGLSSGWGQAQIIISSASSEAGLFLNNTGVGGRNFSIISTSNASGIGGGNFSIGDATSSQNIFQYTSLTNIYTLPFLGGSGTKYITTDNSGNLGVATIPGVGWLLSGNSGTGGTGVLGTTDNQPFSLITNGNTIGTFGVDYSISLGDTCIASGNGCFAIGVQNIVNAGTGSAAIGTLNSVSGTTSIALGENMTITGSNSVGINLSGIPATIATNNTFGVYHGIFQYQDGNQQNGYILTSDASGNASWQSNGLTGYVPTSRTLTINGSSQDLSIDRSWTISVTGTASNISVSGGTGLTPTINLIDTAVVPATYGSSTQVGVFTVDQKGRITSASNTAISITALGQALTKTDDSNVTLTLGGSPTTALVNAASITVGWTGQLSITRGGTGLGSLGTANQLLRVNAGATALEYFTPTYGSGTVTSLDVSGGTTGLTTSGGPITTSGTITIAGTLITSNGGTGLSSYTQGDLLYYNSGTLLSKLAKDTNSTRYLSNQGTSNNPSWSQVNLTNGVTGILPAVNGGVDDWVDYSGTSTIVGWSSFTTKVLRYQKSYKRIIVFFDLQGTSNSTTTTFTMPSANNSAGIAINGYYVLNNGTDQDFPGAVFIAASSSTVNLTINMRAANTWTAIGSKQCRGYLIYEIA